MVNIISDDIKLTNIKKPAVPEKISPVPATTNALASPDNGKNIHAAPAISGQGSEAKRAASEEEIDDTVRELNEHMKVVQRELHFSVDHESGQTVIKVMDLATQQVIRQIPNEEALTVARKLGDGIDLNLLNEYT